MAADDFLQSHRASLEAAISNALTDCLAAQPTNPLAFVSQHLAQQQQPPRPLALPDDAAAATDKWTLLSWAQGVGAHRVVAGALQQEGADDAAALAHLRGLKTRGELEVRRSSPWVAQRHASPWVAQRHPLQWHSDTHG